MSNDYSGAKAKMERTLSNHPNMGSGFVSCSDWLCGCQNPEAIEAAKKAGYEQGREDAQATYLAAIRSLADRLDLHVATYHRDLQPSMNTVVGPEPRPTATLTNLTFTCAHCNRVWFSLEAMTACFRGHVRKKEGSHDTGS